MTELCVSIIELSTIDFAQAQAIFNDNIFKFDLKEYHLLMDLLDK